MSAQNAPRPSLAIGCDHAGFSAKERLESWLTVQGYEIRDLGCDSEESVDYPDYGHAVAEAVVHGRADLGLLLCGTGLGMCYVANRHLGIRASVCWSIEVARLAREHNDANILILPGRVATIDPLEEILAAWLETPFPGDLRHRRRILKIDDPSSATPGAAGTPGGRRPR